MFVLSLGALACQSAFEFPPEAEQPAPAVTVIVEEVSQDKQSEPIPTLSSEEGASPLITPPLDLVSQQDALTALYENVSPGVVSIQVLTELGGGSGSGFVIDKDGHVITNFHVVQGASELVVAFPSGIKAVGEVIGEDTDSDLAIIKVDAPPEELHPLTLGDSDQLRPGQIVIAIGNPFGLNGTMTTGIVSGLGRTLDSLNEAPGGQFFSAGDLIQTDAAINPGNSGGPLLNLNGEVIGINRAIRTFNFTEEAEPVNSGIGFAISINIVKRVVPSLIANGSYDYPYLGISSPSDIPLELAENLGLEKAIGVYISAVADDGPADQAGLVESDVIVSINDVEVRNFGDLISYLFNHTAPGDTVLVSFVHNGEQLETEMVIGSRP
jgi:2-alkenal reductase